MNPTRRIRTAVAALAVALLVPTVASAEPIAPNNPPTENADGPGARGRNTPPAFPMAGDEFTGRIDNRLKRIGTRMVKRLERANIPEKVKAQIRADYKKGAARVRKAAHQAAADGTVTREEARHVRQLARKAKQQMKQKWSKKAKQHRKGKGKAKGKGKGRGQGKAKGKGQGRGNR